MSTLVPLLGTSFNIISCFSDNLAYPPNVPQCSRQIHQRDQSSPRSPSHTIWPGQTVPITNLTSNRPTSSTCSQSKPHCSNNTNEQLANILGWLSNPLNTNQTPSPNTNSRRTKTHIPNTFSSTKPDKLNNFLFQCYLYFYANLVQFDTDIAKINFTMIYLTEKVQDWFEMGLNQKDQSILQDWLSNWNLFFNELY